MRLTAQEKCVLLGVINFASESETFEDDDAALDRIFLKLVADLDQRYAREAGR